MKTIKSISIIFVCLLALSMESSKTYAQVTVEITVRTAPPPLPFYTQPPCPVDGYLWTPGYWAYSDDGYYWVPGVWIRPPHFGYWWTPCYWGFSNGYYGFHPGYWGPHIGYYGGVNYGHGYDGSGFHGGRWEGERFRYNTAVVNVDRRVVHNTYVERRVVNNNNRASFNGPGGVNTRPTRQEEAVMREKHVPPTTEQTSHQQVSGKDRNQFASVNRGRPSTATMSKVGGQGFDPQGHQASARPAARSNQQNSSKSAQQPRTVNAANKNARSTQPSQQQNARSSVNNNKSSQQTHTVSPANKNAHSTQPSQQQNARSSVNNDKNSRQTHTVSPANQNVHSTQPSQQQNARSSVNNNKSSQQTHTVSPANNNNRTSQPSQQRNTNQVNNSRNQQTRRVNQPNNNNRAVESSQHKSQEERR
jgi:hypothetical protein